MKKKSPTGCVYSTTTINLRYTIQVAIYMAILFTISCSKKKSPSKPPEYTPPTYSTSATIVKQSDSITFSAAGPQWVVATLSNDTCKIVVMDTANYAVVSQFTFYLYPYSGIATYDLDENVSSINVLFADYETDSPVYMQTAFDSCTLKITDVTAQSISGTFGGRLTDGSIINKGTFTASFEQ